MDVKIGVGKDFEGKHTPYLNYVVSAEPYDTFEVGGYKFEVCEVSDADLPEGASRFQIVHEGRTIHHFHLMGEEDEAVQFVKTSAAKQKDLGAILRDWHKAWDELPEEVNDL